ncbi:hypothetical protein CSQ85_08890 [Bifidobacterium rousetti]|nr:hypothetical protein CSQ85_08890 [Bifidobacterium rousetti]
MVSYEQGRGGDASGQRGLPGGLFDGVDSVEPEDVVRDGGGCFSGAYFVTPVAPYHDEVVHVRFREGPDVRVDRAIAGGVVQLCVRGGVLPVLRVVPMVARLLDRFRVRVEHAGQPVPPREVDFGGECREPVLFHGVGAYLFERVMADERAVGQPHADFAGFRRVGSRREGDPVVHGVEPCVHSFHGGRFGGLQAEPVEDELFQGVTAGQFVGGARRPFGADGSADHGCRHVAYQPGLGFEAAVRPLREREVDGRIRVFGPVFEQADEMLPVVGPGDVFAGVGASDVDVGADGGDVVEESGVQGRLLLLRQPAGFGLSRVGWRA